ncbi:MAG: HD domain-containing protein [Acidobacteriota bacterium]|nr:MAG: HD domain-containing protein [Acidobacteriota bacterium]
MLYRAQNLPFGTAERLRLADSGVRSVWVGFEQSGDWSRYVTGRLETRVSDPHLSIEDRVGVLVHSSRDLMREILGNPRASSVREQIEIINRSLCRLVDGPDTMAAAVRMMEHDYYTYTHSLHDAIYSVGLARATGVTAPDLLHSIGRGALMHDCGKCDLPSRLINKPGMLTADEWELMKTHPQRGVAILIEGNWDDPLVLEICQAHHEWLDGSGYPRGLMQRAIPMEVRIVSLADGFDAMTSDRAYQRALSGAEALRILCAEGKHRYDQTLVRKLITLLCPTGGANLR